MALKEAKIITVTSVKGGTGKSTTVLNLAGILSKENKKTLIIDLDLYSGVIAASLNLKVEKDIYTFALDLMNNKFKAVEDYTYSYNEFIDVISSPLDPRSVGKINSKQIELILARTKVKYDYILIDTNHIIDNINSITMDYSDLLLYIITNDLMDIKNMKTMNAILKDMEVKNYKIIVNAARLNNTSLEKADIEDLIGTKIDYILPRSFFNKAMEKYIYDGKIMTLEKAFSKSEGTNILKQIIE